MLDALNVSAVWLRFIRVRQYISNGKVCSIMEKQNRREFLKRSSVFLGALAAPTIVPSSVIGRPGRILPSDKIVMGCIGVGWMGTDNMKSFLSEADCQVVAVCDLDQEHLENARTIVNTKYGRSDCAVYHDFRELLMRQDIDAISLGLPDHWHAIPVIAAAKAGKDCYGEKPFAHSLREGRAMVEALKRYGRVWQTGSWQRSQSHFRFACELVRNGCIGKVRTAEVGLPAGHSDFAGSFGRDIFKAPPKELDYDFWLGPAPYSPYCESRVHKNWRWVLDYGGGQLTDWIGHHGDIGHWGLDLEYAAPVEVEGYGEYPKQGVYDTATRYRVTAQYGNGVTITYAGGHDDIRSGTKWIGEHGWVWVDRGGIDAYPKSLLSTRFGANDVHLYKSTGHWRNFLDCIKSRKLTIAPAEVAHRSVTPAHLGQISMLLGRKLRFDPDSEQILNDPTANAMLGNAMRAPWKI